MKIKTKNQNLGDRAKTALKGTFTALNTLHQKTKEVLKSVTLAMTLRNQKMKVKLKTQKPMKQKRKKNKEKKSMKLKALYLLERSVKLINQQPNLSRKRKKKKI